NRRAAWSPASGAPRSRRRTRRRRRGGRTAWPWPSASSPARSWSHPLRYGRLGAGAREPIRRRGWLHAPCGATRPAALSRVAGVPVEEWTTRPAAVEAWLPAAPADPRPFELSTDTARYEPRLCIHYTPGRATPTGAPPRPPILGE